MTLFWRPAPAASLLDVAGRALMIARLIPRAALVIPNLPEAAILTGLAPRAAQEDLAAGFFAMGAQTVLLKSCHADGLEAVNWLWSPARGPLRFAARCKLGTRRGTGCTLATAIAAHLALGDDLATACDQAKRYPNDWW